MADYKTAEVIDSAEAGAAPRRWRWRDRARHTAHIHGFRGGKSPLTIGNVIHFIVAVFFLWPIFVIVAACWSLGDGVNFVRYTIEASVSSAYWVVRVLEEWLAGITSHRDAPNLQRLRGRRRALGHEVAKDWANAGRALLGISRAWSKTFGLGGLFASLEKRIERANQDWRLYVANAAWAASDQPLEFPDNYVVVDELPPGGSSARLYVVRKKTDEQGGPLHVLKYFDLRQGGSLESVIRESQAAELAKRMGLIVESSLGKNAFWYVMPYYHGETLTKGVLRNFKQSTGAGHLPEHVRMSLGYVHQLLQIIAQYHEAGVIHKDIKPDNLIIAGERIYLVDIGLMTPLSSMAQLTTHGTEYFRDPEMVKLALDGREVREVDAAKFDVYSIGAVLFFAVSGEFPTSGALSRLPAEVPLAVQWVVNRAMTGMNQRYANARAMLTDIDYLFWAASTGQLHEVKPADLPSFKGMPVPPHLATPEPANNTQWRNKLAAAPGGYGAWYSAPAYRPKGGFSIGKAAAILFLVGGLAAIGVTSVVFLSAASHNRNEARRESSVPTQTSLANNLSPENKPLAPYYLAVDDALARNAAPDRFVYPVAVSRLDLVPTLVGHLRDRRVELTKDLQPRWQKHGLKPEAATGEIEVLLLCLDENAADRALCDGLEREIKLEAARAGITHLQPMDAAQGHEFTQIFANIKDSVSRHREIATWFATHGLAPAAVVTWTVSGGAGVRTLHFDAIYPGYEQHTELRFAEVAQQPVKQQD
ncbi:MAG: hypothetical protein IPP14_15090 [Planctomycetes bacterium]|nr:hypothetical protein [Planctomycetota bacterium]